MSNKIKKFNFMVLGVLKKLFLYIKVIVNFCIILFIPELLGICYFVILIFLTTLIMKYVELIFHNLNPKVNLPDIITVIIKCYYSINDGLNQISLWFEQFREWHREIVFEYIVTPYYSYYYNKDVEELHHFRELFEKEAFDFVILFYLCLLLIIILLYILIFNLRVLDKFYYYLVISYYSRKEKRFFFNLYVLNKQFLTKRRYNDLVNNCFIYPEHTIFYIEDKTYDMLMSKISEFNDEFPKTSWSDYMKRKNDKLIIRKYRLYKLREILIYIIQSEKN